MFVVPEVLWSPVGNFIYSLYTNHINGNSSLLRNNFLENPDNINILSTVLFIQTVGLLFSSIYLIIIHKNIKNKIMLWVFSVLLFLAAVMVFFLFGFSVSLRHIGF